MNKLEKRSAGAKRNSGREAELKKRTLNILCIVLLLLIVLMIISGKIHGLNLFEKNYEDGIEQIDLNTIYLGGSGVETSFSEVILSEPTEMRKLIVSEKQGMVSTELTDRIIKKLDFDFLKKTQKVSYTGTGYFVVDLDNLTRDCVIENKKDKTVTIKIDHAYLQTIEINPNDIVIDEVNEGLFARGDIELTVQDYNTIEKELRTRLEEKFNTAENGQEADEIALKMVKDVYEPVIRAIDSRYRVEVQFQ